jgi:hypothetical protein
MFAPERLIVGQHVTFTAVIIPHRRIDGQHEAFTAIISAHAAVSMCIRFHLPAEKKVYRVNGIMTVTVYIISLIIAATTWSMSKLKNRVKRIVSIPEVKDMA